MRRSPRFPSRVPFWRRGFPIRVRLTLWYVALLAVILLAFSGALYLSFSRGLREQQDATLRAEAAQLQASVDQENGRPHMGQNEGQLSAGTVAALYDSAGRVLLDGTPRWDASTLADVRSRASHGESSLRSVSASSGQGWRVLVVPVQENGRAVAVLEVGLPEQELEAALRHLLLLMGLGIPATLVLAAGGGLFLAHRALSPIDRITKLARQIGAEDLSRRVGAVSGDDEVGRLAETFDAMLARLEGAFRRERRFTADASHELRTPMAVIASQVDVTLERSRSAKEYQEALRVVGREAERVGRLVSDLLTLARADSGEMELEREALALDELADAVVAQLRPLADARGVHLGVGRAEPTVVVGDETRLMQLLFNLVDNAIKYTPPGGEVTVSVERRDGGAALMVTDTGIGIPPEHLPHLFERFYRVDKARSRSEGGAGLGLAICDWIARAHDGRIEIVSNPGRGSTFTVYLPFTTRPEQ
ncbi:MAG: heavy metal sensor histidine kinase [Dehalococcoidales bacterium]|nr:heavy metal sensor histidine kinase [Dehalococcoidales bacterium]